MTAHPFPSVPSPCIKRCALDADGVCTGCRRSVDEISRWSAMSHSEKQAVWRRLIALPPRVMQKSCSQCGAAFACGSGGRDGGCWCNDVPPTLPLGLGADCLCPACLARLNPPSGAR